MTPGLSEGTFQHLLGSGRELAELRLDRRLEIFAFAVPLASVTQLCSMMLDIQLRSAA